MVRIILVILMLYGSFASVCGQTTCGFNTTLTAGQKVEIKSPGYPGSYGPSLNCDWWITTDPHSNRNSKTRKFSVRLYVVLLQMDIETSSSGCNDYLDVDNTGPICDRNITTPVARLSQSNTLRIRFYSDRTVHGGGFKLVISPMDTCGGECFINEFSTPENSIIDGPVFNGGPTPRFLLCEWKINNTYGRQISLQINDHGDKHCHNYGIYVISNSSSFRQDMCHRHWHLKNLIVPSNVISLVLLTEWAKVELHPLRVNYSDTNLTVSNITATPPSYTSCQNVSIFLEPDENATIASPNFPDLYPHNLNCSWNVTFTSDVKAYLSFYYFNIEYHPRCINDYLMINGKPYCGVVGKSNPGILLKSNRADIIFRTDNTNAKPGFQLIITAVLGCSSGNYTMKSGENKSFSTPSYPLPYLNNANCTWTFKTDLRSANDSDNRFYIVINRYALEDSINCIYDRLTIAHFIPICGNSSTPRSWISNSNDMSVRFRSDYVVNHDGFQFHIYVIETCGGQRTIKDNSSIGSIAPPTFPGPYPSDPFPCVYSIINKANGGIRFNVTLMNSTKCLNYYIIVQTERGRHNYLCNWTDLIRTFTTSSKNATVTLYSHSQRSQSLKFTISYENVYIPTTISPTPFTTPANSTGSVNSTTSITTSSLTSSTATPTLSTHSTTPPTSDCGTSEILISDFEKLHDLFSPNFPRPYPVNITCSWKLKVKSAIRRTHPSVFPKFTHSFYIVLLSLDLQSSDACTKDYLRIGSYPAICHKLSKKQSFVISDSSIDVKFVSDANIVKPGFHLQVSIIPSCGGLLSISKNGRKGVLHSPSFKGPYPNDFTCKWLIVNTDSRKTVKIQSSHNTWASDFCTEHSLYLEDERHGMKRNICNEGYSSWISPTPQAVVVFIVKHSIDFRVVFTMTYEDSKTAPFLPLHGSWADWTAWNSCSKSCGVGAQKRTRQCKSPDGSTYRMCLRRNKRKNKYEDEDKSCIKAGCSSTAEQLANARVLTMTTEPPVSKERFFEVIWLVIMDFFQTAINAFCDKTPSICCYPGDKRTFERKMSAKGTFFLKIEELLISGDSPKQEGSSSIITFFAMPDLHRTDSICPSLQPKRRKREVSSSVRPLSKEVLKKTTKVNLSDLEKKIISALKKEKIHATVTLKWSDASSKQQSNGWKIAVGCIVALLIVAAVFGVAFYVFKFRREPFNTMIESDNGLSYKNPVFHTETSAIST